MRRCAIFSVFFLMALPTGAVAQTVAPPDDATRFLLETARLFVAGLAAVMFILAYGLRDIGLARVQNAPAACLRMLAAFAVSILAFWLSGYELAYSVEPGGLLGESGFWLPADKDPVAAGAASGAAWFFQAGLAGMAAAIVAASVSERVRLWAFLIFVGFLGGLIYPIVIGWTWGGGYFEEAWSFFDRGGAMLHVAAGGAALAAAFVVGPRPGRFNAQSPWIAATTMLPLSVFAAGMAWVSLQGVFLGATGPFANIEDGVRIGAMLANMSIATAAAVMTALIITQFVYDRPGIVTTMCAVIAGPVSLSGDPVSPNLWQAAMIGAVGGVIVSVTPPFLARFRVDDAGFVVPTHLFCGLWAAGIVAWVNPDVQIINQIVPVAAAAIFSIGLSTLFWTALKYSPFGVRQRSAAASGDVPA